MRSVWLIARRELRAHLLSKSGIISTLVMLVLIVGGTFVASALMKGQEDRTVTVGVVAQTEDLAPLIDASGAGRSPQVATESFASEDEGRAAVLDEQISALLVGEAANPEVVVKTQAGGDVLEVVDGAVRQLQVQALISSLGGDPEAATQVRWIPEVQSIGEARPFNGPSFFAALASCLLLVTALATSVSVIATGVVEEKSSRVVEILLSTVKPAQLLGGKVLGIGIYGLAQVVLLGGAALIAVNATGLLKGIDLDLGQVAFGALFWFLIGYALYSTLIGGVASLVSRQEDIGSVITPIIILIMAPLYLGIYLVPAQPDSMLVKVLTQIPFFAPFMVQMRQAFGSISTGEIISAVLICLVTVPILVWLGGRIYGNAVLQSGARVSLRQALGARSK